jgi:hypothetical protein
VRVGAEGGKQPAQLVIAAADRHVQSRRTAFIRRTVRNLREVRLAYAVRIASILCEREQRSDGHRRSARGRAVCLEEKPQSVRRQREPVEAAGG